MLLGLRPEHVILGGEPAPGQAEIGTGVVDIIEPMGSDSLVWVNIGDVSLSSRQEGDTDLRKGQEVKLRVDIGHASVFGDGDSQRRL